MADLTITQADLDSLAAKLDEMSEVLSEKERGLLLAVFKLAALSIKNKLAGAKPQTESGSLGGRIAATSPITSSLSSGFKDSFASVSANNFTVTDWTAAAGGVGIGVIW